MHFIDAAEESKAGIAFKSPQHNVAFLYSARTEKFYRVDYYQDETQITGVGPQEAGGWQPASDQYNAMIREYEFQEHELKKAKEHKSKQVEEPPLPTAWKYYAVYVVLENEDTEQLAVLGNAFNHHDFATKTLTKLLENYPVKSYRVIPVTFTEYTALVEESAKERISQILAFLIS